jgi:pimeloyl-ACP methyl ester carboxylesterase
MSYLMRDGIAVYYETRGTGPAILLTHGFAATGRMWSRQLEMLTTSFTVIAWDLRGHGRTDSPADFQAYTEAETLADMAAILDVHGVSRAIIGGHSLGGYMSLAFHATHTDRVSALLLCGAGPGYRNDAPRQAWNATAHQLADEIEGGGLEQLRGRSPEVDPSDHKSVGGLASAARGMLTQRDSRVIESLPTIAVPTFISVGSNDESYLGATEYLEAKIPHARRTVFDGAGHAANCELPDQFNMALHQFLVANSDTFAEKATSFASAVGTASTAGDVR